MAPDDAPPSPKPDPKVKELLGRPLEDVVDEITAAELQKWFGLPSFAQLQERGVPVPQPEEDPDIVAVRERRAQAMAAVDPTLLDAIHHRTQVSPETLIKFEAKIDVHVNPAISRVDMDMVDRRMLSQEPRMVERPPDIEDELRDSTPQALLRDLHRVEVEFDKTFEVVDMAAEQTLDVVAEVAEAMRTNWKLPPLDETPSQVLQRLLGEAREEIRLPWTEIPSRMNLPNRRVTE